MTDLDDRWTDIVDRLHGASATVPVRPGSIDVVERRARARGRNRIALVTVAGLAAATVVAVVVVRGDRGATTVVDSTPSTASTVVTDSTIPGGIEPALRVLVEQLEHPLRRGDRGVVAVAAQAALANLGYDAGASGEFDGRMEQAVWAFEGLALDRPWQEQTGQLTSDEILRLLDGEFAPPQPLRDEAHHTEIRLDRQVLVVYRSGIPAFIAHISSGSGRQWCELQTVDVDDRGSPLPQPEQRDVCGVATTPGGVFQFYRRVSGNVLTALGGMADPVFFNYGIAVHGANNVPREPVSHGAVRIPIERSAAFADLVDMKEYVYVFDGVTEPEDVTKDRMLPTFVYPNPESPVSSVG